VAERTTQTQTQSEIAALRKALEDNTKAVRDLVESQNIHNARQEPFEAMVKEHEIILRGDREGKNPGLIAQVVAHAKTLGNLERAVWVIVGVALTGIATQLLGG